MAEGAKFEAPTQAPLCVFVPFHAREADWRTPLPWEMARPRCSGKEVTPGAEKVVRFK